MSDLEQYQTLAAVSDAEYALAGKAMRANDYEAYKRHIDRSWAIMDEAESIRARLSQAQRAEIKSKALADMAIAFVRGLGRVQ